MHSQVAWNLAVGRKKICIFIGSISTLDLMLTRKEILVCKQENGFTTFVLQWKGNNINTLVLNLCKTLFITGRP
jgi:hypothetical protein